MAGGIATAGITPTRAATGEPVMAVTTAATSQPLLREGSRGAAVSDWQNTLNRLAAKGTPAQTKIAVDGVFGPKTKAATQAFQRWAHVASDGIVRGPAARPPDGRSSPCAARRGERRFAGIDRGHLAGDLGDYAEGSHTYAAHRPLSSWSRRSATTLMASPVSGDGAAPTLNRLPSIP